MSESQWTEVGSPAYMTDLEDGAAAAIATPDTPWMYNRGYATRAFPAPPTALDPHAFGWRAWLIPEPPNPLNAVMAQRNLQAEFNPVPAAEEVEISGLLYRAPDADADRFSVFFYAQLATDDVTDFAYLVGLSAGQPGHITIARARPEAGLPFVDDDAAGTPPPFPQIYGDGLTDEVLARSTDTVATGEWVHLRLTVLPQGIRSVLAVYRNDLEANGLLKPVWEPVAGIEENFTDNSGLVSGGYVGYGLQYGAASVMGAVDHVVVGRTL